jgi:choline-sulfatase
VPNCTRVLVLLGLLLGCGGDSRPNVLLITLDTTRADRLGAYGYVPAKTPHLDRLAAEGVRVKDATSVAPITLPSHATIFTGLLPPTHGVRDNGSYALGQDAVTLAERLRDSGWRTQAFVSALVLHRRYQLDQGFAGYDDDLWSADEPKLFMIRDRPAPETAGRAVAWLEEWAAGSVRGSAVAASGEREPFFLWVHFFDPHQPWSAPAEVRALAPTGYDAEITMADRGVGLLLDALDRLGVARDTLVVVTADHGESLGEHGEKTHAIFVYDATIRVPLLWRFPGRLPRGLAVDGPASTVDLLPTILGLLGLPGGETTEGRDLGPLLAGEPTPALLGRPRYAESLLAEVGFGMAPLFSVREGPWKLIQAPRPELYDLGRDPGELENRFAGEPRRARRLQRTLDDLLASSAARALAPQANALDRETLEMLQALGYLAPAEQRLGVSGMDPKDGLPLYNQLEEARHLAQQGKWNEAERLLRELLAVLPQNVSARNILALALLRQGRGEEARDEYLRSLADDPKQARVAALLGAQALGEGDYGEARRWLRKAIEITPGFVEAIANLGILAALEGDVVAAEQWYQQALELDPGYPRGWRRLGDLHFERGDWSAALAAYERVLERTPEDFGALLQAGASARRLGQPEQAMERLRQAADLRPDSWLPPYNQACLLAVSGQTEAALAALEMALAREGPGRSLLATDPDLEALRRLPTFAELLGRHGIPWP